MHFTENMAAAKVISVGSRQPEIQKMVVELTMRCRMLGIEVMAEWLSREDLVMNDADRESRGPWKPQNEFQLDFDNMS